MLTNKMKQWKYVLERYLFIKDVRDLQYIKSWLVTFADFCIINTSTLAHVKLWTWCRWMWSWQETGSATP